MSQHEISFDLSSAAMAAHAQGHFWKMHDLLFSNVPHDKKEILVVAEKAGLDPNGFLTDWQSDFIRDQVLVDLEEGQRPNLVGTPSIFLNGIKSPTANKDDLIRIINRLLKST